MSLNIELISISPGVGNIIISNSTNYTKTDWEITIITENFIINKMNCLNFIKNDDNSYTITPKEWKINIESNASLTSTFSYTGSNTLNYNIKHIKSKNLNDIGNIEIKIVNNTDNDILIKSGESYTFTIN